MDYNYILRDLIVETNKKSNPKFSIKECKSHFVIHFWATWCSPCKHELPYLQKIYNKYNDRIDFIFISCDESKLDIDTFIFNNKFSFPVGYDISGNISSSFNVRSIPSSFFIKKDSIKNSFDVENVIGFSDPDTLEKKFEDFIS